MGNADWRVEAYRDMDVYVRVSPLSQRHVPQVGEPLRWGYEVRVAQEGADPADAGDIEVLASGEHVFATASAAEVAAFNAGYTLVDKLLGPVE